MKFTTTRPALQRFMRGAAAAMMVAAVLAGCGGGSQVDPFEPRRLLSFGDEHSVINADGTKYTVNFVDATHPAPGDCFQNPIWIQSLAESYGKAYTVCPGTRSAAEATSITYATVGAKVADIATQVAKHTATDSITGDDLVTVMVGQADILEQYALYTDEASEPALLAVLNARGVALGKEVNAIVALGGKVLVALSPELALSPFGINENATKPGTKNRFTVLRDMQQAFNTGLRTSFINDGHFIGLLRPDELFQDFVDNPDGYGFGNEVLAACQTAAVLPNCNSTTLIPNGDATTYVWADSLQWSPGAHFRMYEQAHDRSSGNPF
ncbi:MAG: Esterase, hydrolase-type domain protein [Rhizobacter sp.]|nr:Esterase, hydrolase-type domain protein [Rhizobacter sp.]